MIRSFGWCAIFGHLKASQKSALSLAETMAIMGQLSWQPRWAACQGCMNKPRKKLILCILNHLMAFCIKAINQARCSRKTPPHGSKMRSSHKGLIKSLLLSLSLFKALAVLSSRRKATSTIYKRFAANMIFYLSLMKSLQALGEQASGLPHKR